MDFVETHTLGHMMGTSAVDHVPKCLSCHKAIVVITERAYCFHDYIYIYYICIFYIYIYIYIFVCVCVRVCVRVCVCLCVCVCL